MDDRITMRITDDAAGTPAGSHGLETRRWSTAPSGGFHVTEGRQPEAANELALTTDEARRRDLAPGDVITASVDGVPQDYSVVGLVAADTAAREAPTAFLADAQLDSLVQDPSACDVLLLSAADGVSAAQMKTAVESANLTDRKSVV